MSRVSARIAVGIFALACLSLGTWVALYPASSDPKNIEYVLWKAGLYRFDLATATSTMIGDSRRDGLVVGKTKD
jgi:hypothetical protein